MLALRNPYWREPLHVREYEGHWYVFDNRGVVVTPVRDAAAGRRFVETRGALFEETQ